MKNILLILLFAVVTSLALTSCEEGDTSKASRIFQQHFKGEVVTSADDKFLDEYNTAQMVARYSEEP